MNIGDNLVNNLTLLDFSPVVVGPRRGLDYTLQLKKINVGSVELTPITIQAIPDQVVNTEGGGTGTGGSIGGGDVSLPNYNNNPASPNIKTSKKRAVSLLALDWEIPDYH